MARDLFFPLVLSISLPQSFGKPLHFLPNSAWVDLGPQFHPISSHILPLRVSWGQENNLPMVSSILNLFLVDLGVVSGIPKWGMIPSLNQRCVHHLLLPSLLFSVIPILQPHFFKIISVILFLFKIPPSLSQFQWTQTKTLFFITPKSHNPQIKIHN